MELMFQLFNKTTNIMKQINFKIAGLCLIATAFSLTSCDDIVKYNDGYDDGMASSGVPVINAIYDVQDTAKALALDSGSLNQMIRIEGANLSHVKSVTFNNLPVDVRTLYATSKACYLKIPRKIPVVQNDSIVYTTEQGSIGRKFVVDIPTLTLDGLKNEFVKAGNKVQVVGEYFDIFGYSGRTAAGDTATIVLNGSTPIVADSITENYMGITIPKGTPDNSIITFNWVEKGINKTKNIPYRPTQYLLAGDFSSVGWWGASSKAYLTGGTNSGDPESLGYPYLRITGSFDQWSWNSIGFGANWPCQEATDSPSDYVFKFEVWCNSSYPFYDSTSEDYNTDGSKKQHGYMFALNDANTTEWNPSAGSSFNTYGKWVTISLPLISVANKGVAAKDSWSNINIVMQPTTAWKVDHAFANFRVQKKNF